MKGRRNHGTTEANGHAQAEETRRAYADGTEGPEGGEAEGAEGQGYVEIEIGPPLCDVTTAEDLDFNRTDSALRRLMTEPGETWVLETDQSPDLSMEALAAWSQTRGVTLLVFGEGERFTVLATKPGDTVVLFTDHPEHLNLEMLGRWAQSRGIQMAALPSGTAIQNLDDDALDQMGLQRKNRLLVLPGGKGLPTNLKGPA